VNGVPSASVNFKNLPPGDYSFKVKAKFANATDNTTIYSFTIKPWYRTNIDFHIFVFILVMGYYIHKAYRNYYHKQKEKLIEENNLY
jgi:hypothetical protein